MAAKKNTAKRTKTEDKIALFVEALLSNGGNATEAALQAGYSKGGAAKAGYRLSKNVQVMSLLDKRRTEIVAKMELSTEKTFREIARIAYADPRKIMHEDGRIKLPHELDDDTAAAIASFEVGFDGSIKYKFWPKAQPLDMANKIQGHYEKDNKQKVDPLSALIESLGGNVVGVAK